MKILHIVLAMLLQGPIFALEHTIAVAIETVDNSSHTPVKIVGDGKVEVIKALARKNLRKKFFIPFVSINAYRDQFLKDEPYTPEKALLVYTKSGTSALWEDETGIIIARVYKKGITSWSECIPTKLFRSINNDGNQSKSLLNKTISVLLLINAQDEIHLDELHLQDVTALAPHECLY